VPFVLETLNIPFPGSLFVKKSLNADCEEVDDAESEHGKSGQEILLIWEVGWDSKFRLRVLKYSSFGVG
jgi:hypothetical protein